MSFELGGRKADYVTPDGRIAFFPNHADGPGAYDVIVGGRDHFYILDRTMGDLTDPGNSTEHAMRSLENMCAGRVKFILEEQGITPEQLHIALLQLRIKAQEEEIRASYGMPTE